jgi:heme exporter protein CcmD
MSHLLHLGYAQFVWPAYAVSLLGLGAAVVLTLRAYAKAKAQLALFDKP